MTEQDGIRSPCNDCRGEVLQRHRTEFRINQRDIVAVIDEGATDREQPQRRQLLFGDTAADGWMGHVCKDNLQLGPLDQIR
ncbi:hypothetical protein SAMN05192565_10889 [Methylobacterium gossipiicola]|uniref:Uncharacterized protein n=1 Tax=Methylobacterium gossipiicola TaxID=582675 RepID=A0A1I2TWQ1_9HYPH|nr:hypothetical protein SAMN05192565_10889 [Methylobacterium gossipiicola]